MHHDKHVLDGRADKMVPLALGHVCGVFLWIDCLLVQGGLYFIYHIRRIAS